MSDLSRHRPYLIWGGGLVLLAVIGVLALVPTGAWVALDERRSSTRVTPDGVAALARSLDALGVPVGQRYRSFADEPIRGGGLAVLQPVVDPSAGEVHAALEWVRAGGTLLYSPALRGGVLADSLGVRVSFLGFGEVDGARDSLLDHPWTGGPLAGPTRSRVALRADSVRARSWVPLALVGDSLRVGLAWLPEGDGGVLVLADAGDVANRNLDASVQAVAATRALVDRLAGDSLFFSEYHQALDGRRGLFRETFALTSASGLGRAALHLAAAGFFVLLLSARRFGAPFPEGERGRRSTLEHVEALAGIYRAAESQGTAARHLVRGVARRLDALHGRGADPEADILRAWAARPDLAGPAEAALAALRAEPPDLVALEGALDAISARHAHPTPGS